YWRPTKAVGLLILVFCAQDCAHSYLSLQRGLRPLSTHFPLAAKAAEGDGVRLIGPLADVVHWDWYGGTPPYTMTPLQAIRDEVGPNVKVNYAADDTQNGEADAIK